MSSQYHRTNEERKKKKKKVSICVSISFSYPYYFYIFIMIRRRRRRRSADAVRYRDRLTEVGRGEENREVMEKGKDKKKGQWCVKEEEEAK